MGKILMVGALVLFLLLGAGGAYIYLRQAKPASAASAKPVEEHTVMVPLDERTVNLADATSAHYAKMTVTLEIAGIEKKSGGGGHGGGGDEAPAFMPVLMDVLIDTVSRHTYVQLLAPSGKRQLKDELCKNFNVKLQKYNSEVKSVMFTDFVME